ncbi:hypothetical protein MLD38_016538 [Melastoma candidum]|uniref:Uncharacterized protein n=1 Tax=Melastoma candidum TaxID=119954 RepID=A0ACB9QNW8_9MYRT|nr:hypothetical protein MLD38_016538 [Melastoma candidum]
MSSSSSFPRTPPHPSPQPPPSSSSSSSSDVTVSITSPLLSPQSRSPSRPGLFNATLFLRRTGSGRVLREPSMRVRETAAEQLEERQTDWAYSKPVVILDVIWNFAFITATIVVMVVSRDERPSMPLRVWIAGYAFQCLLHVVCVVDEFRRRERRRARRGRAGSGNSDSDGMIEAGEESRDGSGSGGQYVSLSQLSNDEGSRYCPTEC